jgi:hypothetical protein
LFNYKRLASVLSTIALTLTTGYLLWGIEQNDTAIMLAQQQLQEEQVPYQRINAYPTLLQLFLRRLVVHTPEEVRVGFISTWAPQTIRWNKEKKVNSPHQHLFLTQEKAKVFAWFAEQQYVIIEEPTSTGNYALTMKDLRIGYPGKTLWGIWELSTILEGEGKAARSLHLHTQSFGSNSLHLLKESFRAAFGYSSEFLENTE